MLETAGFVANQEQSAGTLLGMKLIMGLIPATGAVLAAVVLWRYPLDAQRHCEVLEALDQRRRQWLGVPALFEREPYQIHSSCGDGLHQRSNITFTEQ